MTTHTKTAEIIKPFGDYRTPGPNDKVIEILKKCLEEAERGEIVAVAITSINAGGWINCNWECGSRGRSEIVGAVTMMQHDIMADWKFQDNDAV